MDAVLRLVDDPQEVRAHLRLLEPLAAMAASEFRDDPLPSAAVAELLERHLDQRESLLLRAELRVAAGPGAGEPAGLLLSAPLIDPLSGERLPLIVILHVRRELRHRGLARRLVDEAARLLGERGCARLAARAGHNDDALISMGERWGFVRHWELMLRD